MGNMIKLLYVEDDIWARNMVSDALRLSADFEIDLAVDGEEGVNKAIQYDYDIIIMDIMLPDIDGWEATRRIKLVKPDAVVISLSALSIKDMDCEHLFSEYVRKPIKPFEFKKLLKVVANRYQI